MADQLDLDLTLDTDTTDTITGFLAEWIALENEEDRLREAKLELKDTYAERIPLRAVLTAIKVVRAQRKLDQHHKEPMPRRYQPQFEALVDTFLQHQQEEQEAIAREAEAMARGARDVPGMTDTASTSAHADA